jgi:hypothetical protein
MATSAIAENETKPVSDFERRVDAAIRQSSKPVQYSGPGFLEGLVEVVKSALSQRKSAVK